MILYITSHKGGQLLGTREAVRDTKNPQRIVVPPYHTLTPVPDDEILQDEYWAYVDENGQAVRDHSLGTWVKKEKQVKVTAYHKQTQHPKEFDDKALVTDDYTLEKPVTQWDEWIDDVWVTNQSNQHIADFNRVNDTRRSLYTRVCDPLISEANMKRLLGNEAEAQELEAQAVAARAKIQAENPWPTPPELSSEV